MKIAGGKIPHFDKFVPSSGDDQRSIHVRRESDTGYPVSMSFIGDFEFKLSQSIPEVDSTVS